MGSPIITPIFAKRHAGSNLAGDYPQIQTATDDGTSITRRQAAIQGCAIVCGMIWVITKKLGIDTGLSYAI
jgi:hypothetical protein